LLKRNEHKLDASISEVFHSAMPNERSESEPRKKMEKRLSDALASSSAGGFLAALEALSQAHGSVPTSSIQALNFHDGSLEMQITAPDATSLDRMTQSLKSNGWQANLTSGNVVA